MELQYSIITQLCKQLLKTGNLIDGYIAVEKWAVGKLLFSANLYGGYKEDGICFQSSQGAKACMDKFKVKQSFKRKVKPAVFVPYGKTWDKLEACYLF